jgi:hypothetical protein
VEYLWGGVTFMTTIDTILVLLSTLAPLVPVPGVTLAVQAGVSLARELEKSGVLDTRTPIEISALGDLDRQALDELRQELHLVETLPRT